MRRGFIQPHFDITKRSTRRWLLSRSGAGFTLVELLISIAITGILAAMMFNNFSQEKERNGIKAAISRLQTDLKAMQTNAQSGISANGVLPLGFGIHLTQNGTSFLQFADLGGTANVYDGADSSLGPRTFASNNSILHLKNAGGVDQDIIDIVYTRPNGQAVIMTKTGTNPYISTTAATITIKNSKLNLCYDIEVVGTVGTVQAKTLSTTCN